ncbi:hypothetical protein [Actinomycetospora lemnae]|uniref:Uncharacterized protein n=1 Tax=Actinomycetospora lemnae TaxID=3019891 RepID=A0ABT5SZR6_9PSEU|nr:hypothetical protein [Actinomycetospora sp. DW7H6]MDD7967925.1 hypothetical protein [Actinomycetospora sp. DW7H6]
MSSTGRRRAGAVTRNDVVAAFLVVAAVAAFAMASVPETTWPLADTRATAVVVLVLGLTAAVVGGSWRTAARELAVMRPLAALGGLAALAAVGTLVTGSQVMLAVLVVLTVVLWALATIHHLTSWREPPGDDDQA